MAPSTLSLASTLLLRCEVPFLCVPPFHFRPPVIVLSGTRSAKDLLMDDLDIRSMQWPFTDKERGCEYVHRGFARRTKALLHRMQPFLDEHDGFVLAGHSMGGACAVLAASELKRRGKKVNRVYTFGMPRLGSKEFATLYDTQGLASLSTHFSTPLDPVVHTLPRMFETVGPYTYLPCIEEDAWRQHDMQSYHDGI